MREIKFRYWDTFNEEMVYYSEFPSLTAFFTSYEKRITADNNPILMYFTGLHDKKGRRIWEGDVVTVDRRDSFPSFNKAIIVYADIYGAFLLQYTKEANPEGILSKESIATKDGKTIFGYCTNWKLKVIGNIYENPELLEGNR